MLKTNDSLLSINNEMVQGSPDSLLREVSSEAVLEANMTQKKSLMKFLKVWLEEFSVSSLLISLFKLQ
ncbi:hypothetical protein ARALYDRAFT_913262 [Arabidopsis lyrata subsp. lyrata]|uniref:Uncharacterized protein n=1 Tax=Arabidopsis lyrata subsp. lyrata TaxID=81972 RepID=D7MAT4_ARALL|nr:hypothetical protein ARALYDRAFT_913262 [Arabidopsis lyrata subsp. lyrata]